MIGVTALVALLEFLILWALNTDQITIAVGLLGHIILGILLFGLSRWYRRTNRDCPLADIAYPVVMFLGIVGASGMFLTSVLYVWYRRNATPFEIWYREILPERITPPEERLIERLMIWGEEVELQIREPIPFVDILSSGELVEKQLAITLMLRNFHPTFAPAFRQALKDPDNAVRVQAASAIIHIEDGFLAENLVLERRKNANPHDLENLEKLAKHYDEHASTGLADSETLIELREKADKAYEELYEEQPVDADLWLRGRLLVRSNRLADAAEIFEKALSQGGRGVDLFQRVWYWECLYKQSRYTELREQIGGYHESISSDSILPQNLLESIDFWKNDDFQRALVLIR